MRIKTKSLKRQRKPVDKLYYLPSRDDLVMSIETDAGENYMVITKDELLKPMSIPQFAEFLKYKADKRRALLAKVAIYKNKEDRKS